MKARKARSQPRAKVLTADAKTTKTSPGTAAKLGGPPEQNDTAASARSKNPNWLTRLRHCVRWYFQRRDDWSEAGKNDVARNEEGRLRKPESVSIPAVWITEVFTPSTAHRLAAGIQRLRWTQSRDDEVRIQQWMEDVRQGRIAGSTRMGRITSHSSSDLFSDSTADLPAGIDAVFPTLTAVTPSLTVMTARFVLGDKASNSISEILSAEYRTTVTRRRNIPLRDLLRYILCGGSLWFPGHEVIWPDLGRRRAAQQQIEAIEDCCREWTSRYFGGAFTQLPAAKQPTAVLVVTEQVRPLSEEAQHLRALEGLGIQRHYDAWVSKEWPGGRLALPSSWAGESKRLTFACRRADAFPPSTIYQDPTSNWTLAHRVDELVEGFLSRWAATEILDAHLQALSVMRDELAKPARVRPIRNLKALRKQTQTILYDVRTIAREVTAFTKSKERYNWASIEWHCTDGAPAPPIQLLDEMRAAQRRLANSATQEAESFASTALIANQLSNSVSNVRTQRLAILISVVSLAVAAMATYLAYVVTKGS